MNRPDDIASFASTVGAHPVREPLSQTGVFTKGLSRTGCAPTNVFLVQTLFVRVLRHGLAETP